MKLALALTLTLALAAPTLAKKCNPKKNTIYVPECVPEKDCTLLSIRRI